MLSTSRMVEDAVLQMQQEHRGHEERLAVLRQKLRLSPDEEMEMKRLKKLKLRLKDRMFALKHQSP